jgi:hypothetical protein
VREKEIEKIHSKFQKERSCGCGSVKGVDGWEEGVSRLGRLTSPEHHATTKL